MTNILRRNIWLFTLGLLAVCAVSYGQITTHFDTAGFERTGLSAIMGCLGLFSVLAFPKFSSGRKTLLAIALPALLVRLLVLPAAPSDDTHRYLWEGKLLSAGENPYEVVADHPSRTPYHDQHWEQMNHRDKVTAYPPLAITAFSLINKLGYSQFSYKAIFTLLDLALIACILALLHHHRKPLKWASFYALSPIAFLAYSAEAHFDILMVLPLVAGVLCFTKQRYITAGILLALAIHFKLMVAVAIPFFIWRSPFRMWLAFSLALFLPLLPFWDQLLSMLEALAHFGSVASFNGPSYQLLYLTVLDEPNLDTRLEIINLITAIIYALIWCAIAYKFLSKRLTAISASTVALSTLVFFSPVVHFWYLAWVLPLITFTPRISWLSLSVTSSFYFLVWHQLDNTQQWELPIYARILFWLPFVSLSVWKILGNKHIFATTTRDVTASQSPEITIVIPTRNAGANLNNALVSIANQTLQPKEVIIVDANSTDGSLEDLSGVTIIQSPTGRGVQIKSGIQSAKTEWVVILHADAKLSANALATLHHHINTNHDLVGGCFGQRFDNSGAGLLLVEILNESRGTFAHTSFGDQAQFLHRPTAIENNCVSDQPLMEDVELSDRLRPYGQISYLGTEVTVSAEKWRKYPFWQRFILIVRYFFRYRLMLWKSAEQRSLLAQELVREYYSTANR